MLVSLPISNAFADLPLARSSTEIEDVLSLGRDGAAEERVGAS